MGGFCSKAFLTAAIPSSCFMLVYIALTSAVMTRSSLETSRLLMISMKWLVSFMYDLWDVAMG